MTEISVVVPVYNQPRETLVELVRQLSASLSMITEDFDIIFVDDGSINDAWSTISDIASRNPRVTGFRLSRNFGQHIAITAGLDRADGNWVVVMDADLQDRPEVIPALYAKACEGYDVVFVNRVRRPESLLYQFTTACFYRLLNLLSGQEYNRTQGNFSIVSAEVVRAFRRLREPTRFYGGMLRWVGFKHGSIDAPHGVPHGGRTTYSFRKRIRFAVSLIVGFSTRLLYVSIALGLAMALVSFAMAAFIIAEKLLYPDYPVQGWPSVMTAVVFIGGVTNVTIGLMGLYIGQVLQQTRDRPLYIVASSTAATAPLEK
jgi:dolichol-phosphate mannosyltransferase